MSLDISVDFMRKVDRLQPDLREILYALLEVIEEQRQESINREDFHELKGVVKELAEAQKRTELKIEELAEAQKRTELKIEELAGAQKRTELKVEELAEAQKRTELKIEELAGAQKQTELKIEELAGAQKRTEEEIKTLVKEHRLTRQNLGGLSMTVGYILENEAFKKLPALLEKDFGITIKDRINRQYVVDNEGAYIEVNIFGCGEKEGRMLTIIGESKTQLSKNDVDAFFRKKVKRLQGLYQEMFLVLVTHMISSHDVEAYARGNGVAVYYSYDF